MIECAGEKIFYVDFHCQWTHDGLTPVFLAGLSYLGFDAGVMVVPSTYDEIRNNISDSGSEFLAICGREYTYNWGHVVSVGYSGDFIDGQSDFRTTLSSLRSKAKMVIFAHPMHLPTRSVIWDASLTDTLLDEGLFDAVELINGYNLARDMDLVRWYYKKLKQGSAVPITGGCDVHYPQAGNRPSSVYSPEFPPCGKDALTSDIDYQGSLRTLVLAEDCTEDAIIDAVKKSRTIIETDGKLFGPPHLVKKLINADYWKTAKDELKKRRALALVPAASIGGMSENFSSTIYSNLADGAVTVKGKTSSFHGSSFSFAVPKLEDNVDSAWMPISIADNKTDAALVSAIKVIQPVGIDIFGARKSGSSAAYVCCTLKNNTNNVLSGKIASPGDRICNDDIFENLKPGELQSKMLRVNENKNPDIPRNIELDVEPNGNLAAGRKIRRSLTFVGCRHSADSEKLEWAKADVIRIERQEQVAIGRWDGPSDSSAKLKLLWSKKGLHISCEVKDDLHIQPFHGEELYQGDCIQLGVDVLMKRDATPSSIHEFLMGLTETGPESFCTQPAMAEPGGGHVPCGFPLSREHIKIFDCADGFIYEGVIPWDCLKPFEPRPDAKFGLAVLLFDNDGEKYEVSSGCKSVMIWPDLPLGGWKARTNRWAVITLL